jgi:hypothetical protein
LGRRKKEFETMLFKFLTNLTLLLCVIAQPALQNAKVVAKDIHLQNQVNMVFIMDFRRQEAAA